MNTSVVALDSKLAGAFRLAIETTFQDNFQIEIQVNDWSLDARPLNLEPYITCAIEMRHAETNKKSGIMIVGFSREIILKVLNSYGLAENVNEKVMKDAAEELVNIIYGMVKTSLNKMGYAFKMSLPFTDKQKMPFLDEKAGVEKMVLPFSTEGHECRLIFVQMV